MPSGERVRAYFRVQYLTSEVPQMRGVDYDTTLLVHAIKGREINPNQYARVKIGPAVVSIREANKDRALEWFAKWAAPIVAGVSPNRKVLISVPNRHAFLGSNVLPRTAAMAEAIRKELGDDAVCADILRWKRELPKSTDSASRQPSVLLPDLALTGDLPWGTVVLVDDVFTSGGHAIASTWRLQDTNRTVKALICCGRTTWVPLDDPFSVAAEDIDIPPRPPITA